MKRRAHAARANRKLGLSITPCTQQLEPAVHVDTSAKVLQYLAPHLRRVVYVHAAGVPLEGAASERVVRTRSLADYADMREAVAVAERSGA